MRFEVLNSSTWELRTTTSSGKVWSRFGPSRASVLDEFVDALRGHMPTEWTLVVGPLVVTGRFYE